MPLGNEYVFRLEGGAEVCAESDSWNNALRGKYNETVSGTSKYKFDAVIMHTYYEPDNWQDIPIGNITPETGTCAGTSELWQFDEYDTRLQNAYDKIIGIGGEEGNFRDFLVRTTTGYKAYQVSMDKFNDYFDFDLTTAEKKDLWVTEWNLKDQNKNLTDLDQAKTEIYSNGFVHAHLLMNWWLKNIKINFDTDFRQNFFTYSTLQNYADGTTTDLISLSDGVERNYFDISGCPFADVCGDGCSYDTTFDVRNYYIRRTNYFVTYLFSEINKKSLKYLPSTYWLGHGNMNVAPTAFIDNDKDYVYIYFTNVKSTSQNYVVDPDNLLAFFPTADYVELGEATITYLQADQLYSTSGKSSLYNETLINTCYATYDHPFEITPTTESGIDPAIVTNDNEPECTGDGIPVNGCLSAPAYSVGYFKIPIYPMIELKMAGTINDYKVEIYPNPATSGFTFIPILQSKETIISDYRVVVYSMNGNILKQSTCKPEQQIDISNLPSGLYQVEIIDALENHFYKKLLKIE
jgi:hypothetical protein